MLGQFASSLIAVTVVSLVSLAGVFALLVKDFYLKKWIHVLVAISIGALIGDVFVHIIPELYESEFSGTSISIGLFIGILVFFILEKFFHWKHEHGVNEENADTITSHNHSEGSVAPVGKLVLVADGMHNLIDGVIIGISFMASVPIGIATTIAVILHEIPQEIADFGVLIHAGYTKNKALLYNFLSALTAVLGVAIAFVVGEGSESFIGYALSGAAGGFLYIATSDLVPELHKKTGVKDGIIQVIAIIVGFSLMVALLALE